VRHSAQFSVEIGRELSTDSHNEHEKFQLVFATHIEIFLAGTVTEETEPASQQKGETTKRGPREQSKNPQSDL
jgi:hypothetical protein